MPVDCPKCNRKILYDEDIRCGKCKLPFHLSCVALTNSTVDNWICELCTTMEITQPNTNSNFVLSEFHFNSLLLQLSSLTAKMDENNALLQKQSDQISKCASEIVSLKHENTQLKERLSILETQSIQQPPTGELMYELRDRIKREKNVVIYNLKEADNSDPTQTDYAVVINLLKTIISITENEVASVMRLGQTKNPTRPRPIKVTLSMPEVAINILRNKYILQSSSYRDVKIRSDLTKQQTTHLRQLNEQLRQRKLKGETNITIKYKNGEPTIVSSEESNKRGREELISPARPFKAARSTIPK
ncbi:hypothetical protein PPYR_06355 [Photinus pyralis]|uniref:Zinc finger PHD-type domain-containing protein n=1 Tax=Photinus pyralis TaxID=7054 RepID=A0A1Y1KNE2_PHOPY|nr:uncharacterized protein LOC116167460 [Photinus pyralis]XP_031354632.1 uncharacterized protein LOC116179065 [Photinus pyralis]KAB0793708.1 hypothetical protein PPYR_13328 [Photinus pyralis]KAB0800615.1 hypothetical protein PPYR_06355 [Photinus pyralis]